MRRLYTGQYSTNMAHITCVSAVKSDEPCVCVVCTALKNGKTMCFSPFSSPPSLSPSSSLSLFLSSSLGPSSLPSQSTLALPLPFPTPFPPSPLSPEEVRYSHVCYALMNVLKPSIQHRKRCEAKIMMGLGEFFVMLKVFRQSEVYAILHAFVTSKWHYVAVES